MSDPFSKSALENLTIDRFIVHVVHDGGDEPLLLEEILVGDYEPFFVELVQDCAKGNRYLFNEASPTRAHLVEIAEDPAAGSGVPCGGARFGQSGDILFYASVQRRYAVLCHDKVRQSAGAAVPY